MAKKIIKIILKIILPIIVIILVAIGGYFYYIFDNISNADDKPIIEGKEKKDFIHELFSPGPERITAAGFGVDKDGARTDVIIVGSLETKTGKVDLFSVPRDTFITLSDEMYADLNSDGWAPREMKINELHAYAGEDEWYLYVVPVLEELLGISIDHYAKIDLSAFKDIVDVIGGVDFYVPMNMYYQDPYQDLYINLNEGQQVLNGEQAEMLIRYRYGYNNGDIGRINTQQEFIKALTDQLLSKANILNAGELIEAVYDKVETDLTIAEALSYATKYISKIDVSSMATYTLPGEARYINQRSYYVVNKVEVADFINNTITHEEESKDPVVYNDMELKIELLNGGSISGLAGKVSTRLSNEGYTITSIGTYNGSRIDETRIFVREKGMGEKLKEEFDNATIYLQPDALTQGVDIQVVIGKSQDH